MRPLIVTHCGAGSSPSMRDAAKRAGERGLRVLRRGGDALEAVEEAIVVLEDDPRTNAGIGSRMRLDGTVQMDAALMDSDRRAGAVAAISNVRNPIRVARRVMDTPHVLLAGEWATRFARRSGFPFFNLATDETRRRYEETLDALSRGDVPSWARAWLTYEAPDTVGAAARDARGRFAAGNSSGGVSIMLPGRVGDSPVIGAGLYAGPAGAVTVTGVGEEILRHVLGKHVYDRLEALGVQGACDAGLALYPEEVPIGIVAVGPDGLGESNNRKMAWWGNARPARTVR